MCLAIPALVTELLDNDMARVSLDGVTKVISLALVDDVAVGDYVVLHVGYALARLDAEEAERTLALLDEMVAAHLAEAIPGNARSNAPPNPSPNPLPQGEGAITC
jgi:hydrogenase expression/formation protein HypC